MKKTAIFVLYLTGRQQFLSGFSKYKRYNNNIRLRQNVCTDFSTFVLMPSRCIYLKNYLYMPAST